jgi:threonine dehydratase
VDVLMVPSGGGGLLAGLSSYFKSISPSTHICAVEPDNANPMYLSLSKNKMVSVDASRYCDGSSVKMISKVAFDICR